jgi:tetratricopeptide (TPR) repeat protein
LILDGIDHCVQTNLMAEDEAIALRKQLDGNNARKMIKVAEAISTALDAPDGEFLAWLQRSVGTLAIKDREIIDTIHALGSSIATTNYDDLLTRGRGIDAVPWTSPLAAEIMRGDRDAVLHLHGYYLQSDSVILGVNSYKKILADRGAQAIQQAMIARSTLLFIGSGDGLTDPNFGALLKWRAAAFGRTRYRHYCLCRKSERAALQKRFPLSTRLFYIEYGDDYPDLASFLRRELVPFARPRKPASLTLPPAGYCIGRDAEVAEVVATLLADKPQPLPILGGPGMGKTTIALTALHDKRVANRFGVHRWFIRCDGVKTRQELAAAIAQTMGIPISAEVEAAVLVELAARPSALLIDNAETPLDAGKEEVVELIANLASIESLALIVTIRGQRRPPGITWRSTMEAERLDPADAREVFVKVAGRPQFANDADLDNLLKALDGMALAITLMARYAEAYETLESVWSNWQAKHTAMLREGAGRLANLNTSFDLSMAVLSSEAQRLLSILAMLPDGVALIDLLSVFAGPEEVAHELRNRALIFEEAKRLRMLAPLREYVAAAYPPSHEDQQRAVDRYLELATIEGRKLGTDGGLGAVSRLAPEVGNVETMLLRSGIDEYKSVALAVYGWALFMRFTGVGSTGVLETVVSRAKELGHWEDAAQCIASLGDIALRRSDRDGARTRHEEALSLYRNVKSVLGEANCIRSLGDIALETSDIGGARTRYEEALPLYRKVGNVLGEANCFLRLGDIALRRSDHDGARARYEEAQQLYRKVGGVLGEANCIRGLGDVALMRSDPDGARARYKEALPLYQRIEAQYSIAGTHRRLARLSAGQSRKAHVDTAREAWRSIKRNDLVAELDKEFGADTN